MPDFLITYRSFLFFNFWKNSDFLRVINHFNSTNKNSTDEPGETQQIKISFPFLFVSFGTCKNVG